MPENKKIDFIIVGQGLAGTLLAHFLLKKGKRICVIDNDHKNSSSKVAAGIINPITGRRFAKSWKFDEFHEFNKSFYPQLEKELKVKLYRKRTVLRSLQKIKDVNNWHTRCTWDGFEKYMKKEADWQQFEDKLAEVEAFGEIDFAAQVDVPLLLKTYKKRLEKQDVLVLQNIDYEGIMLQKKRVTLNGLIANKIIFCEGQRGRFNPFFSYLPFEVSKGEILIVKIPLLKSQKIIKDKLIVAPLGDDLYWCGSNFEWEAKDDLPTEVVREELIRKLRKMLKIDFEVVKHLAAIRPTVKDRRPFLGVHPEYPQLAIFNGLGTKGASMGPYLAKQFSGFLTEGIALNQEVDIKRFTDYVTINES